MVTAIPIFTKKPSSVQNIISKFESQQLGFELWSNIFLYILDLEKDAIHLPFRKENLSAKVTNGGQAWFPANFREMHGGLRGPQGWSSHQYYPESYPMDVPKFSWYIIEDMDVPKLEEVLYLFIYFLGFLSYLLIKL